MASNNKMNYPGQKCEMFLLAGNSHPELTTLISTRLGLPFSDMTIYQKANKETQVEIKQSVRGKDVYIIQTGTKHANNDMMELMIIAYACKTNCARNIVGVVPYLPYSRQCKMRKRGSIVCKLLASMLSKSGLTHLITMDLHQKEIQGFFDIPVDNLRASPFLIEYIVHQIPDYRNAIIVARNANSVKRATSYAERLRLGIAVIHGEEKVSEMEVEDGRNSPPVMGKNEPQTFKFGVMPALQPKEKPPMHVVGDIGGRIAIIIDDMVDEVLSFVKVAQALKERGAYKIYVMAVHGLLSSDAANLIDNSCIDEVVVTNTVPHEIQKLQCHKIKTVDVSLMLTEAIRRIHHGESMSYLFKNIGMDD